MRKHPIITGENYHVYNRGVDKRNIFGDKIDIRRFVESIKEFNQTEIIGSLNNLRKSKKIQKETKAPYEEPLVVIIAYCLNPNHFHFILKQLEDGGIAKFMQKLQSGYTSYFNVRNKRTGSLFQGTFKAQHIASENYFNKTLGYVNKNYQVHNLGDDKKELIFASDYEYEHNDFKIVSKIEGNRILEIFGGVNKFKKHSDEIVEIIRKERSRTSLLEDEGLSERA